MWLKNLYAKISNWINYSYGFTTVHQSPQKIVIKPGYWVAFDQIEKDFLTLAAASFNFEVDYSRGYRQKEIALIPLTDVTFLGNSGAVVKQNKIIKESVFDQLRLAKSPAFRSPAWMVPQQKAGLYTSLMHLPWAEKSNYHWFLDCLPRLYAIIKSITAPTILIIPASMPAFQRETLDFLLREHPGISLQTISKKQKWQLPDFALPTFVSNHYSGFLPPDILNFIRPSIWHGYGVTEAPEKSRLYISRGKAAKRRLLQEADIIKVLDAFGFTTIYAEDFTYAEQVRLFYNARLVVGAHGAGLTNILFGRDLQVVELHPADMVRSHYFMICKALGFNYHYLIGSAGNSKQDFYIEPEKLKQFLTSLLENENAGKAQLC
ncbi:MAG: glycosyltransferase family 61 protein [Adhaeribacter sp.]|nr:glycosyltransferase family 61 protein [Adhaeribacter sp.]